MQCMAQNDYYAFIDLESRITIAESINGVQLRNLQKQVSRMNVIKSISFLITNFNNQFNAKGKLTEAQIIVLSGDLFTVFEYESLEDVTLMFKYARQGKIGDGKDFKLDGQTIFHKWVPAYLELKAIERENQHTKSNGKLNGMATFNWQKEDIEKLNVSEKLTTPTKLGQRLKQKIAVDDPPQVVLKNRAEYLKEMFLNVKRMTTEQLKNYLIKADVNHKNAENSIPFDPEVYQMVETEIDLRFQIQKQ